MNQPELDGKDVPFASASEVILTESGWPEIPDIVEQAENWDSNSMNGSYFSSFPMGHESQFFPLSREAIW